MCHLYKLFTARIVFSVSIRRVVRSGFAWLRFRRTVNLAGLCNRRKQIAGKTLLTGALIFRVASLRFQKLRMEGNVDFDRKCNLALRVHSPKLRAAL